MLDYGKLLFFHVCNSVRFCVIADYSGPCWPQAAEPLLQAPVHSAVFKAVAQLYVVLCVEARQTNALIVCFILE